MIREKDVEKKRKMKNGEKSMSKQKIYMNRELSWVKFNERVLEEAEDKKTPLCERLSFA